MLNPSFFIAPELTGGWRCPPAITTSNPGNLGNPMENGWGAPYTGRTQ